MSYHEINGTLMELVTFVVKKIRVYHQCTLTAKQLFEFWFSIRDYLSLKNGSLILLDTKSSITNSRSQIFSKYADQKC